MYKLRPHHGLCTAFFCGHGYSDVFTRNMREKLRLFGQTDPWIMLTDGADCLCAACPHNLPGHCEDAEKVHAYDQAVLAHLGLQTGAVLRWEAFCRLVDTRILATGKLAEICGDCMWYAICGKRMTDGIVRENPDL